jgi:uncharacterized phage-associated protein
MAISNCFKVARYFLASVDEETGDSISNLKLQKLVYYAQGLYLALYDVPLFDERIEAWTHGPVIPELYYRYKAYGANPIPPPEDFYRSEFTAQIREVLEEVWTAYGQFSAAKLRNMTHGEPPWAQAYNCGQGEISTESMKKYFKTQLVEAQV